MRLHDKKIFGWRERMWRAFQDGPIFGFGKRRSRMAAWAVRGRRPEKVRSSDRSGACDGIIPVFQRGTF